MVSCNKQRDEDYFLESMFHDIICLFHLYVFYVFRSVIWNMAKKNSVHKNVPNDRKVIMFIASAACFEALKIENKRTASNILKIIRHLLPPSTELDDKSVEAIKEAFAMNRIVDVVNKMGDDWIETESLMKSLIQFMYRYLMLPGMKTDVPKTKWESTVVPLVAKCMKEHPKQKELQWCGTRIMIMAYNDVGLDAKAMDESGAFSAIAVSVENHTDDDVTTKKASALLARIIEDRDINKA